MEGWDPGHHTCPQTCARTALPHTVCCCLPSIRSPYTDAELRSEAGGGPACLRQSWGSYPGRREPVPSAAAGEASLAPTGRPSLACGTPGFSPASLFDFAWCRGHTDLRRGLRGSSPPTTCNTQHLGEQGSSSGRGTGRICPGADVEGWPVLAKGGPHAQNEISRGFPQNH